MDRNAFEFLAACQDGNLDKVKELGPKVKLQFLKGFETACENGEINVVKYFVNFGLIERNDGLITACRSGNTEAVWFLLRRCADPVEKQSQCLIDACKEGHEKVVEVLLKDGRAEPSAQHSKCFISACAAGNEKVVALLLKDGRVDLTRSDNCFTVACFYGHVKVVEVLFGSLKISEAAMNEGFLEACSENRVDVVSFFISMYPKVLNASQGFEFACLFGRVFIVQLLLPLVNSVKINLGFVTACERSHTKVVQLLLQDPRLVPDTLRRGFRKACELKHIDIIKLLLKHATASGRFYLSLKRVEKCGKELPEISRDAKLYVYSQSERAHFLETMRRMEDDSGSVQPARAGAGASAAARSLQDLLSNPSLHGHGSPGAHVPGIFERYLSRYGADVARYLLPK